MISQPRTKQTIEELHALTVKKNVFLKAAGYKVVEIWEHQFLLNLKNSQEIQSYVDTLDLQERLRPRDSFFGGRTNATRLHYKIEEGEEIKYVDFTSLYPWVNKYSRYPVGHPEIIVDNFLPLEYYFGLAKVKISAPRGLYIPVLPHRSNGKLKFPLCRTCADTEHQKACEHTPEERCFVGTWCIPELLKAIEKGYTLLTMYEVYHWCETTQYDPLTKTGGIFTEYINTFLKLKQEASGWPSWCKNKKSEEEVCDDVEESFDEKKQSEYLFRYEEKEGIKLDPSNIRKNPGLRCLAKLMLNSFWGKFGQKLNKVQTRYFHDEEPEEFFKLLTDPTTDISKFHILTDSIMCVEYTHKDDFVPEDNKTNIFLASFTTCWARLKLFSVLDTLNRDTLYHDTDSVIYVSRLDTQDPPLGDFLGDLTNELAEGTYIEEFVSGGPKNYAFRTNEGEETCKVRGFSLNYTNSHLINFEVIRDMVLQISKKKTVTLTNPSKITRDKNKQRLYNRLENKKYKLVYTKRVVQKDLDTLPYGY
jgi:hypothetical protein